LVEDAGQHGWRKKFLIQSGGNNHQYQQYGESQSHPKMTSHQAANRIISVNFVDS
jgi:hypothetical protein